MQQELIIYNIIVTLVQQLCITNLFCALMPMWSRKKVILYANIVIAIEMLLYGLGAMFVGMDIAIVIMLIFTAGLVAYHVRTAKYKGMRFIFTLCMSECIVVCSSFTMFMILDYFHVLPLIIMIVRVVTMVGVSFFCYRNVRSYYRQALDIPGLSWLPLAGLGVLLVTLMVMQFCLPSLVYTRPYDYAVMIVACITIVAVFSMMIYIILNMNHFINEKESVKNEMKLSKWQAEHDGMTGLYNKGHFMKLQDSFNEIELGSVVYLDINNLKQTNDILGHELGDLVINTAAARIQSFLDKVDYADGYRIGGDEFVIVSTKILSEGTLRKCIRPEKVLYDAQEVASQLAYGIGIINGKNDFNRAFLDAEKKMYQHKKDLKAALRSAGRHVEDR